MEPLIARMDFDLPDVPADFKQRVEDACNDAVRMDRQIDVRVLPAEAGAGDSERHPHCERPAPVRDRNGADRRHQGH
jgi:hypothetical protein